MTKYFILKDTMLKLNLDKFSNSEMIITSVIFAKLKNFLTEKDKLELFEYIKVIKNNNWIITIKTTKPIVNSELKLFQEEISELIKNVFESFWVRYKEVKVVFR